MNKWIGAGNVVRDPEITYTNDGLAIAKYNIAIGRRGKDITDFIPVKALGKTAEFAEKYLKKGMKIIVDGEIQTGSYKDKDGNTRYTWEVMASNHEFCEKKNAGKVAIVNAVIEEDDDDFMTVPEGIEAELPFA